MDLPLSTREGQLLGRREGKTLAHQETGLRKIDPPYTPESPEFVELSELPELPDKRPPPESVWSMWSVRSGCSGRSGVSRLRDRTIFILDCFQPIIIV